jgi:hypothetical protein
MIREKTGLTTTCARGLRGAASPTLELRQTHTSEQVRQVRQSRQAQRHYFSFSSRTGQKVEKRRHQSNPQIAKKKNKHNFVFGNFEKHKLNLLQLEKGKQKNELREQKPTDTSDTSIHSRQQRSN